MFSNAIGQPVQCIETRLDGSNRIFFQRAFKKKRISYSEWLLDPYYAGEVPFEGPQTVRFAKGPLGDLFGITKDMDRHTFLDPDFLVSYGKEFCVPSDAFHLRMKYAGQPKGEIVNIGMKQIASPDNILSLLRLTHNDRGLGLYDHCDFPVYTYSPDSIWCFREKAV